MKKRFRWMTNLLFSSILGASGSAVAQTDGTPVQLTQQMVAVTTGFLGSLGSEQRSKATYAFDDEERFNWHFIPRDRLGIPLKELDATQLEAATTLLRTFLSQAGMETVEQIRSLELVLLEIETVQRFVRDPDLYYLTVFGEPALDGTWAVRFEGHHLAFNWTFAAGVGVASTPQFLGSNPAEVASGARAGLRVLGNEEDIGRSLLKSFTAEQAAMAILPGDAPRDIISGNTREVTAMAEAGIGYAQMNAEQQALLFSLIREIAGVQASELMEARMERIFAAGVENVRFVWMGGSERGEPHYYRIQGPSFLIEYDNTQNDNNHVHLVWRDFNGDFGADLLQQHYDAVGGDDHVH